MSTALATLTPAPTESVTEAELFGMIPFNYDLTERELAICLGMCVGRYIKRLPRQYSVENAFVWGRTQGWIVEGSAPYYYCLRHPLSPKGFNCGPSYTPPQA